ncbi:GAF and ANTAR domain-containing protein [Kribbella sp. CA-247076]|uniref:GAF and ANTAR domain-containing protein n=1 Tax=Kribbella sp. CA-247076 TaxID=3239941 RepID=UPI003D93EC9D
MDTVGLGTGGRPVERRVDTARSRSTADEFARLAVELHAAGGVESTVEAVVEFALHAVGCDYAGILLVATTGVVEIGAVTDPMVETIYRSQLDAGEGPALAALEERAILVIQDASVDDRWPRWRSVVGALGIGGLMHVPMRAGQRVIGVLSLYKRRTECFDADDEAIAQILARHASVAVATARHEETWARAVDARKLVGQAMGILMERFDLDSDQAFGVLRRYSQHTNTKLRDVAQQLIETRKLPH